jgi:hypothetical protein
MKLTATMRDTIVQHIRETAYGTEIAEVDARLSEVGGRIYRYLIAEEEEEAMRRLPRQFFRWDHEVAVYYRMRDDRYDSAVRLMVPDRPLPAFLFDGVRVSASGDDALDALGDEVIALLEQRDSLVACRSVLAKETHAFLQRFGSLQQLRNEAPNLAKLIPDRLLRNEKAALPVPADLVALADKWKSAGVLNEAP